MLFPNCFISAQVLFWSCWHFSSRGCSSQEVWGCFSGPSKRSFQNEAWREDRRQLIIIWCPKSEVMQIRWDFHLLCTRTSLIFLLGLRLLLLFHLQAEVAVVGLSFEFQGCLFWHLACFGSQKLLLHHKSCNPSWDLCHQERFSFHNWGCFVLLC